jgi:hypothetical protein
MRARAAVGSGLVLLAIASWLACGSGEDTTARPPERDGAPDESPPPSDGARPFVCGPPQTSFARCAQNPLLRAWTATGQEHEWTRADPSVLFDEADQKYKMWFSTLVVDACDSVTDDMKTRVRIKYAESVDGLRWEVQSEPALDVGPDPADWDHHTVETPSVIEVAGAPPERRFALLYSGANGSLPKIEGGVDTWQIGAAFSPDGRHFTRDAASASPYFGKAGTPFADSHKAGLVLYVSTAFPDAPEVVYGSVADPEVVFDGTKFHLWFSSAGAAPADGGAYRVVSRSGVPLYGISHATSDDLTHWVAEAGNPRIVGGGQPAVVRESAGFRMLYSRDDASDLVGIPSATFPTRGFFEATSADGLDWKSSASRVFAWQPREPLEDLGLMNGPALLAREGELLLFYSSWTSKDVPAGSCILTNRGRSTAPGVAVLNLATRAR